MCDSSFFTILNIKSRLSIGNMLHFIVVVNCPLTEKYMSHFRPDNIFFRSTYRRARYDVFWRGALLNFKVQTEGFDDEDSDWEGGVTVTPHLDKNEKENYNPNVDVCYSVNAWMGKEQCQWRFVEYWKR